MNLNITFDGDWYNDIISKAVNAALVSEGVSVDCEVEVVIVSKDEIKDLNNETRGIDKVTDVLSYPMFESADDIVADHNNSAFLGSIVICSERALEQAEEYGHSAQREAAFLAVHSVLHLLGYDHELGKAEESEMFSKQENILNSIGLIR